MSPSRLAEEMESVQQAWRRPREEEPRRRLSSVQVDERDERLIRPRRDIEREPLPAGMLELQRHCGSIRGVAAFGREPASGLRGRRDCRRELPAAPDQGQDAGLPAVSPRCCDPDVPSGGHPQDPSRRECEQRPPSLPPMRSGEPGPQASSLRPPMIDVEDVDHEPVLVEPGACVRSDARGRRRRRQRGGLDRPSGGGDSGSARESHGEAQQCPAHGRRRYGSIMS